MSKPDPNISLGVTCLLIAAAEDVKRMLALEDQLFEVALKYHLLSKHASYLPECYDTNLYKR